MPEQTNPAKRLYAVLDRVISHGEEEGYIYTQSQQRQTSREMRNVWMEAMEIDEEDEDAEEKFHDSLSEVLLRINSCEQIVKRNDTMNQDLHIEQLGRVKKVLFSVRGTTWREFREQFNRDFMRSLQWAAEDMSNYWDEEVISEENLGNLQANVEDIINRVADSELDAEFKQVLLDGLESVRQAILNYRVTGAEGIRNAVDRNVSSYARHQDDFKKASKTEYQNIIHAYKKIINEVNVAISTALKFKQLAEPATQILPMLGMG